MKNQKAVITYGDEAGVWQYSVSLSDDYGNWLDSFLTLGEAREFCKSNNLEIVIEEYPYGSKPR